MLSIRNASKFNMSFIIGAVLIIVITSCSPKPSPSDSPTQTFTNYPSITSTPKPSITSTSTFNSTPTQTLAVKPNPTIVIDPTAFLTPFPTVPFDEAAYNFEILLHTNGGCQLPCFWGMTPGETTAAELIQFGNQFSYNSDFFTYSKSLGILYYRTFDSGDTTFAVRFLLDNGLIHSIDLGVDTARYYVTLPKLLDNYGKPTKVLIGHPNDENNLPMLVLFENQQFMGEYILFQNSSDNSLYCYDPPFSPQTVITWAPDTNWINFINQPESSLKDLKEVSDYNILSISEKLRTSDQAFCFHIQSAP